MKVVAYQVLVDAFVELPLGGPALPQLVVVVIQALPVAAKLLQAGLVDVVNPRDSRRQ